MKLEKIIENVFFPSNVVAVAAVILIVYLLNTPYSLNHLTIFLISALVFLIIFKFSKKVKSYTKRYTYASSSALIIFIILLLFIQVSKEFLFGGLTVFFANFIIHFIRDVWKISAHTLIYTAFCMSFSLININFVFLFVFLPFVAWSRLKLKRHNLEQIVVAFVLGIIIPFIINHILSFF